MIPGTLPTPFMKTQTSTYVGPGNVVSGATMWGGLRAYTLASIGSNAVKLRRDSDNTTQTFVTVAGGGLDLSGISTFKGTANLFVDTLYDQTGNGNNLVQATQAKQPTFTLSGLGSLPIMSFISASGLFLGWTPSAGIAPSYTFSTVARRTSNFTTAQLIGASFNSSSLQFRFDAAANTAFMYAGVAQSVAGVADNTYHALQAVYASGGAGSDLNVDGTVNTINPGNITITATQFTIGTYDGSSFFLDGQIQEFGIWPSAFTSTNSANMSSNQHSYWGF